MEEWKFIGINGYEISNKGRVRSNFTEPPKLLKPYKVNGRLAVELYVGRFVNRKRPKRTMYVHRLVADRFISPLKKGDRVGFVDGDFMNCDVTNIKVR